MNTMHSPSKLLLSCSVHAVLAAVVLSGLPRGGKFFGLNVVQTQPWSGTWQDKWYRDSVSEYLQPGVLRYPGGTVGNYWDWQQGWFRNDINWSRSAVAYYRDIPRRPYTLADFALGVRSTDASSAVLSLNMLTSNISYELAGLHAAAAQGIPVTHVELGNEFYLSGEDVISRFPTASDYAREAEIWAQAVRSAFPDCLVAVVGAYSEHAGGDTRRKTWNAGVYAALAPTSAVNGLILHVYQGTGFGACSPVPAADRPVGAEGSWGSATDQEHQQEKFTRPGGVDEMLAVPTRVLHNITDAWTAPPQLKIIVTEFNLFDRCGPVRLTWAHGLYAALMAQRILAHERIELACYHALGGNPMFTALFTFNTTFAGLQAGSSPPPTHPGTPTAPGFAVASLNKASRGAVTAEELHLALPEAGDGQASNVTGFTFAASHGATLGVWLINAGSTIAEVMLPISGDALLIGEQLQAKVEPTELVAGLEDLAVKQIAIKRGERVRISPYAIVWGRHNSK